MLLRASHPHPCTRAWAALGGGGGPAPTGAGPGRQGRASPPGAPQTPQHLGGGGGGDAGVARVRRGAVVAMMTRVLPHHAQCGWRVRHQVAWTHTGQADEAPHFIVVVVVTTGCSPPPPPPHCAAAGRRLSVPLTPVVCGQTDRRTDAAAAGHTGASLDCACRAVSLDCACDGRTSS